MALDLWDNHKLSTQIGTARFLANFLPEDKRPAGVVPFLQGRLKAAFKVLDTHLEGRDWIVGKGPTIRGFLMLLLPLLPRALWL